MDTPAHVYTTYIRASLDAVWDAITNPDMTAQYYYGTRVDSSWEVGAPMTYSYPDGTLVSEGSIIAIDPPNRLEFTFHALWDDELRDEGPVREVWALADVNGMVKLTVEMYDIDTDSKTYEEFTGGFAYIIAGLKSTLETGEGLPSPHAA